MSLYLGVDPGAVGGAALLDGSGFRVLEWWTWSSLNRKGGRVWRLSPGLTECDSMGGVGWALRQRLRAWASDWRDLDLVVEGLFVPRVGRGDRRVDPQSVIPLAEACGELIGGLGLIPMARPLASTWRPAVLGLKPRTPAKEAGAYAVKAAHTGKMPAFRWPNRHALDRLSAAELEAVCEAAFIARWGATCR